MSYYVYENWRAQGQPARVHTATCRHCNNGRGQAHPVQARRAIGQWYGPFATIAEARAAQLRHADAIRRPCKVCRPYTETR
jgi:hypothetical protein